MILSDLERWDAKGQNFPENLDNYAPHKERPITVLIFVARGLFLGGNARQCRSYLGLGLGGLSLALGLWFGLRFGLGFSGFSVSQRYYELLPARNISVMRKQSLK